VWTLGVDRTFSLNSLILFCVAQAIFFSLFLFFVPFDAAEECHRVQNSHGRHEQEQYQKAVFFVDVVLFEKVRS